MLSEPIYLFCIPVADCIGHAELKTINLSTSRMRQNYRSLVQLIKKVDKRRYYYLSQVMRKPDFCPCENKGTDQLCSGRIIDQGLCFCYSDCTIPLLLKSKNSSIKLFTVTIQAALCQTWSETLKTIFSCHDSFLI